MIVASSVTFLSIISLMQWDLTNFYSLRIQNKAVQNLLPFHTDCFPKFLNKKEPLKDLKNYLL